MNPSDNPVIPESPHHGAPAPKEEHTAALAYLPIGFLNPNVCYLQQIIESLAKKLAENWDEQLFDPLTVSIREGELYVIDGRHRLTALKLFNSSDFLVPCKIFKGLTMEEKAALVYRLQKAASLNRIRAKKVIKEIEKNELS